ncbi:MAG: hypothetical protein JO006_06980 [Paucibacter sp.]|nr:hypothetical protein [Roseateles sp.]
MNIGHYVAWFFGGAFLLNAVPHIVAGAMGEAFQSPFATPPGEGRSSSMVNVLWGFFNAAVAWVLLVRVGSFDLRAPDHALAAGLGAFLLAVVMAPRFGRFNGGNKPE